MARDEPQRGSSWVARARPPVEGLGIRVWDTGICRVYWLLAWAMVERLALHSPYRSPEGEKKDARGGELKRSPRGFFLTEGWQRSLT